MASVELFGQGVQDTLSELVWRVLRMCGLLWQLVTTDFEQSLWNS